MAHNILTRRIKVCSFAQLRHTVKKFGCWFYIATTFNIIWCKWRANIASIASKMLGKKNKQTYKVVHSYRNKETKQEYIISVYQLVYQYNRTYISGLDVRTSEDEYLLFSFEIFFVSFLLKSFERDSKDVVLSLSA